MQTLLTYAARSTPRPSKLVSPTSQGSATEDIPNLSNIFPRRPITNMMVFGGWFFVQTPQDPCPEDNGIFVPRAGVNNAPASGFRWSGVRSACFFTGLVASVGTQDPAAELSVGMDEHDDPCQRQRHGAVSSGGSERDLM